MRSQAVDRKWPSLGPAEEEGGAGDGEKGGKPTVLFFPCTPVDLWECRPRGGRCSPYGEASREQ